MARAFNAQWANPLKSQEIASSKKGLGSGAWVGIGIACAVALGALVVAGVSSVKRKDKKGNQSVSTADSHMGAKLNNI